MTYRCPECGQPVPEMTRPRFFIGQRVAVRPSARARNQAAGISWTDEMDGLINRTGKVVDITDRYVSVKFSIYKLYTREDAFVTGVFRLAKDAVIVIPPFLIRRIRAAINHRKRNTNIKSWFVVRDIAKVDRDKGLYSNPFKSDRFAILMAMKDKKIQPKIARQVLGNLHTKTISRIIRQTHLNLPENNWIADMLAQAYDEVWNKENEERQNRYLIELMTTLLRENSLTLNARVLRAIENRDFEYLKRVGHEDLRTKHIVDYYKFEEVFGEDELRNFVQKIK